VFWDGGKAVLVDFGIAQHVPAGDHDSEQSRAEPGARAGTRAYMSPEQLAGAEASPASDLYAGALVIYEAYTSRHWIDAQSAGGRVWARVPWVASGVLRHGLAWKPEDGWPDAAALARQAVHRAGAGLGVRPWGLGSRRNRRGRGRERVGPCDLRARRHGSSRAPGRHAGLRHRA